MNKNSEVIEIKDFGITYPVTLLSRDIEEKLKEFGLLDHMTYKDSLLYHLELNLSDYYDKEKYTISFVKGLYSYGYNHDLWEVAVMRRKNNKGSARGVKGNLTDNDLLNYIQDAVSQLKNDQSWYDNLPIEYYKYE